MQGSAAFEFVAGELERSARLDRAAARGALRSALALALFDPVRVTASQLRLVIERLLAAELERSGLEGADRTCQRLATRLASERFETSGPESPDDVFSRLIRR
ncbi:MAG TPA: hypothetical protein VII72_11875 [Myxococcota bacterium]|jgi:hypothetical protein